MMAAMEITEDTPMTMPSTVNAERTLEERRVSSAARKFSRVCARLMMAISRTSTPQSGPAVTRAMPDRSRKIIRLRNSKILPAPPPMSVPLLETGYTSEAPTPPKIQAKCPQFPGDTLHDAFQHELAQDVSL